MRRRTKYIHGLPARGRNKLVIAGFGLVLLAVVFVPWQSLVLKQYGDVQVKVKHTLLGESTLADDAIRLPDGPAPAIPITADPVHAYGMAVGNTFSGLTAVELDKRMADMSAMHSGWLQFDVSWQAVQPKDADHYNWTAVDKIVRVAGAHRLKMVGTLTGAPAWARPPGCLDTACAPNDAGQFAEFASQAAAHYAALGVQVWEVWHEPNSKSSWQPRADAAAYTKVLQAAFSAIKIANPQALVLTGGTEPQSNNDGNINEVDFLNGIYKAGGKGFFDAVADHPHTYPLVPSHSSQQAWSRMSQTGFSMRGVMVANGDAAKKIWLTAFGAPTKGPGASATQENYNTVATTHVDEGLQALILIKAAELYPGYDWAGPLFWYGYKDTATNSFGLINADGTKKASYEVFKRIVGGS